MRICVQFKPEQDAYHNLFNILILVFDQLLSEAIGKAKIVPMVVPSGSRNHSNQAVVEVE